MAFQFKFPASAFQRREGEAPGDVRLFPIGIDLGLRRFPFMATALAVANIWIFFRLAFQPDYESLVLYWGYVPQYGCLATLITHMFLHGDVLHLLGNMVFFILPAMKLEDAIGTLRFAAFYLLCGIAANACHVLIEGDLPFPMIGASGAIAGVVGGFMVLYPVCKIRFWVIPPLPFFINLHAWFFMGFWFCQELFTGYRMIQQDIFSPVAVWAHVGGFAFGALTMWTFNGWNQGALMELRSRRFSLLIKGLRGSNKAETLRRQLGFALQGLVLLYTLKVLLAGGVFNPDRPSDSAELNQAMAKGIALTQDLESLVEEALDRGSPFGSYGRFERDQFVRFLNTEFVGIARAHRQPRGGVIAPAPGRIRDLRRFFNEEFDTLPEKCRISVGEVQALSVFYTPGYQYEIFCGTAMAPLEVFRAYLKQLNERGWMVDSPIFDRQNEAGLLFSSDGEWELSVIIKPDRLASPYPVAVLWLMEKL